MDVHIGEIETTVRAVDDRSVLSPQVLEALVAAVLERLDARDRSERARGDEARPWTSVRDRGAP